VIERAPWIGEADEMDSSVFFSHTDRLLDQSADLAIHVNYQTGRWGFYEPTFGSKAVITTDRKRLLLYSDGTFTVEEENVPARRPSQRRKQRPV